MDTIINWIFKIGLHHIIAMVVSVVAAIVGFRLSREFEGRAGKALKWFALALFLITLPHTLEFLTTTHRSLPLERDTVRLLKALLYVASGSLFAYAFYLFRFDVKKLINK